MYRKANKSVLLIALLLLITGTNAQGQTARKQFVFGLQTGFRLIEPRDYYTERLYREMPTKSEVWWFLIFPFVHNYDYVTIQSAVGSLNPPLVFSADYGIWKWFSCGVRLEYAQLNGTITQHEYAGSINAYTYTGSKQFDFIANRYFLGISPKVHWPLELKQFDIHSGFVWGGEIWETQVEGDNQIKQLGNANRPLFQVMPVGIRCEVVKNLSVNAEIWTQGGENSLVYTCGLSYKIGRAVNSPK